MRLLAKVARDFEIIGAINQLIQGRTNATGSFTCKTSTTTTTVSDGLVAVGDIIIPQAQTANAAGELATLYIPEVTTQGVFKVVHSSAGTTDRTFGYRVEGGTD